MPSRQLRPREIEISIKNQSERIKLKEVNSLQITIPNRVGSKEGITRNFLFSWHVGIIDITIQGKSWIGAFLPSLSVDNIDTDLRDLKAALNSFQTIAIEQEAIVWVSDENENVEFYVGYMTQLAFTETSENPYYVNYTINFKSNATGDLRGDVKTLAKQEKNNYFYTFTGEKQYRENEFIKEELFKTFGKDPELSDFNLLKPPKISDIDPDAIRLVVYDLLYSKKSIT